MLAKRILLMMAAAILMATTMVVATLGWTAKKNNEYAANDSYKMVQGGIAALQDKLETLNWDYSGWTAAMDNALREDPDWLTDNMGSGADGNAFDAMQITWPSSGKHMVWTVDANEDPSTDPILPSETVSFIHDRLLAVELGIQGTDFSVVRLDGRVFFISAALLQPWGDDPLAAPKDQLPLNFMLTELTDAFLTELGESFLIDEIGLTDTPVHGSLSIPLLDADGALVAAVTWAPPQPGTVLIRTASVPLSIAMLAFLVLTTTVTLVARRSAKELHIRDKVSQKAARTDTLTGTLNRLAFNEKLLELSEARETVATLFMDLNDFKKINDSAGHLVGDAYIKKFAEIARGCVREKDFIARIGGDEFNVLFMGKNAEQSCERFVADLQDKLEAGIMVGGVHYHPSVALGYAINEGFDLRVSEMLRRADLAMYEAKARKLTEAIKYTPALEANILQDKTLFAALQETLPHGDELQVVYQPIVNTQTGEVEFSEALLRWNSPEHGRVPPGIFIPIAEKFGLINDIGNWLVHRVLADMSVNDSLSVSINISPIQLRQLTFAQDITNAAKRLGVDPARITLEITEGVLIEQPERMAETLEDLKQRGFKLALDDFGTGFSSIGYLRKLSFDKIKIDKSYVDDLTLGENGKNLMIGLSYLAESLNLQIVAEGVETEDQYNMLSAMKFDFIQGYLFSKPVTLQELTRLQNMTPWIGADFHKQTA